MYVIARGDRPTRAAALYRGHAGRVHFRHTQLAGAEVRITLVAVDRAGNMLGGGARRAASACRRDTIRAHARPRFRLVISAGRSVLVLAPHTDDGEFGCGGTIARLVEAGAEVRYVAFSSASRSLPAGFPADTLVHEVRAATATLGIPESHLTVHDFEVRTFPSRAPGHPRDPGRAQHGPAPDLVLTPSLGDIHQDHETIARESMRAFKRTTLLGYEIPWNCFNFRQQAYVALEPGHVDRKVAALQCYRSQAHRNYANEEYVRNVARTRGIEGGRDLAEVFEVYRWFL